MHSNCLFCREAAQIWFNPFVPSGLFHLCKLDKSIFHLRGVWIIFHFYFQTDFSRNSYMPHSDLGLHFLPTGAIFWDG